LNESILAFQFFDLRLATDATLLSYAPGGLRRSIAPAGTLTPFTAMLMQSPNQDTLTITAHRVLVRPLFQIVAVGIDSPGPLSQIAQITNAANQIDTLLGREDGLRNIGITGGFVSACYRESMIATTQEEEGQTWQILGGLYRIELYSTS
jgi:hypothetical protein